MAQTAPRLFEDRVRFSELDPDVLDFLQSRALGKPGKKRVQFCGLICLPSGDTVVFLPRKIGNTSLKNAQLTMRALARFGRETPSRTLTGMGEFGNCGILSVISQISDDFRRFGVYAERHRMKTRNAGKIDWPRTIIREPVLIEESGDPVYSEFSTTMGCDFHGSLLAQIQAALLREIYKRHGWWLPHLAVRKSEFLRVSQPRVARKNWPLMLKKALSQLYSSRAISLANLLIHYMLNDRATDLGSSLFGVEDFQTVWETMLRRTLCNVEDGWNSKLPKPVYETVAGGVSEDPNRGMRTDIIVRDRGKYFIVDAKYYDATHAGNAPGFPDFAKQIIYERTMAELIEKQAEIESIFAFPASGHAQGPLKTMRLIHKDTTKALPSAKITCVYVELSAVMTAYTQGHRRKGLLPLC